jgi:SAM-dependent MidA family methyltransferase
MLEAREHIWGLPGPLQVIEIGGGTGTLAASILVRVNQQQKSVTLLHLRLFHHERRMIKEVGLLQ